MCFRPLIKLVRVIYYEMYIIYFRKSNLRNKHYLQYFIAIIFEVQNKFLDVKNYLKTKNL